MRNQFAFFPVLFLVLTAQNSAADDFRVITNASVRGEYNDNIFFSRDNKVDDFITTASMGIQVRERTERLSALLKCRIDGLDYADNDELNDIEEYYDGRVSYQVNPLMKFSGQARYTVDSRPDRDIDVTGYIFNTDVRRQQHYSLSTDYQASEKIAFFSSYSYQDDQFEVDDNDTYTGQNFVVGLSRSLDFTKPTTARLNARYSSYDFFSSKVENYKLTVGFSRNVNEKLSYIMDIGPRHTEVRVKGTGYTADDDGMGGRFTLTFKEEFTTAEMNFFHEISGSSGRDGVTKRTGLAFSLKRRLGERSFARMSVDGYLNTADRDTAFSDDLDELTTTLNPSLHYEFNRDLSCEAAYRYSVSKDREDDYERHRNMIFLKLMYQFPVVE
ncbi:MAG: hypothetical protein U9O82_03620 [Thermodesulfobacteriota bacterium]|nr:hypothetical protein [Thermodesulfobacteriota bacterium]